MPERAGVVRAETDRTAPNTFRWKLREAVSRLLWRLHLYGLCGWWDAGTDTERMR